MSNILLDNMKLKLGINTNEFDTLLSLYLDDSAEYILGRTNLDEVPDGLYNTQVELAIIYYNKAGIEGQTSYSEGGISRSFEDVPASIDKKINRYRVLPR